MGSHHQVCVDKNTEITHRLNWVDRGPVDEQRRPGQLVLASRHDYNVTPQRTAEVSMNVTHDRHQ